MASAKVVKEGSSGHISFFLGEYVFSRIGSLVPMTVLDFERVLKKGIDTATAKFRLANNGRMPTKKETQ